MSWMATGAIAFSAVLSSIYGVAFCWKEASGTKTIIKTVSIALLVIAAIVLDAPWLIAAGLAFGALGDFFLSRPGEGAFLSGMAAFALGHVAYAASFWAVGGSLAITQAVVLLIIALSTEVWLAPHTGTLRWPVRVYTAVIAAMALAGLTLRFGHVAQIGALLFVASDLLLALELFVVRNPGLKRMLSHLLWMAYWTGQLLILLGMLDAGVA